MSLTRKLLTAYRTNSFFTLPLFRITRPRTFYQTLKFLKETENWTYEEMFSWQLKKIIEIVNYAYEHVPYYRKEYSRAGFLPGDIKTISDFEKLPCVGKDSIKRDLKSFISDEADRIPYVVSHTGGSTDKPMEFYLDKYMDPRENAFFDYYWGKFGFHYGQKCVVLRGDKVAVPEKKKFYEYDRIFNYKKFDSDYITDPKNLPYYDLEIKRFGAKFIRAFPSSLYSLAKVYRSTGITPPCFDMAHLASENTYEDQLKYICDTFSIKKILYNYGHSECVVLAIKYADNEMLGFMPQYGYMELLDSNGSVIRENGVLGEIVGTGFSRVMPFIRYKTGDCAALSDYQSDDFMRFCKTVSRIEGRLHEFVVTRDGRLVSTASISGTPHLKTLNLVGNMQYEQMEPGKLIVKVTAINPTDKISFVILEKLRNELTERLRYSMEIQVVQVPYIEKTNAGKRVLLKQGLDIDKYRDE